MQPVISFRNFSFRYKSQTQPTLKNIDLDIAPGEKIWIAGPSGSGKSTLAHCINGLIPFSYGGEVSGGLYINGEEMTELGIFERSSSVGTILQNPDAQFVGQTVGEDVAFQMENEQVPQSEMKARVITALELVGMLDYEGQGPQDLSGGQKQSVSLAGVLSTQGDILLFDEPLANLDPASGVRAMQLIQDIHRRGETTVIIIEHRVEDVLAQPIDRIVVMNEGEIAAVGSPETLLREGLLPRYGLRQPLYLNALGYAGVGISGLTGLGTPEGVQVSPEDDAGNGDIAGNGDHSVKEGIRSRLEAWTSSVHHDPATAVGRNAGAPLLELRQVSFAYGPGSDAVSGVTLSIHEGERVALLGSNGAGKSTLSGLITGILKPRSGKIAFRGEDLSRWSIRQRGAEIGYVMQNPNHMITQHMIRDEIGLGLMARGVPSSELERRTDEALRICGLYPYRNWPVSGLSFGQKKRLTIASILALEPKLMILDEPTAGQDYRHYTEFMDFIDGLADLGMAFLFITHDMHLALEYADRAVVMAEGRVIAADRVAPILSDSGVTSKARLRETSLSRFAKSWGLSSPASFVQAFIDAEKKVKRADE
ncbi:energy-coupling factor transport system ATP-binding protein [Fontibacillus phaseoli]|uniref:Energy-coupling factor transport system ATP-binding protein n=1 Tax=Fontibacillus phaseoli TaxID=1416533 RepID=A0A369BCA6_9BACL|nr:energy-coupling factor transporter ATPase [Fontibacillus phaseoli]RCX19159.1 energy-coupling factor transport system ATP-binding protein [Fontibacillus phaseoli]